LERRNPPNPKKTSTVSLLGEIRQKKKFCVL